MSNKMKDLRKQLRNVVLELMPELVKEELYTELQKRNNERSFFFKKNNATRTRSGTRAQRANHLLLLILQQKTSLYIAF